MMIMCSFQQNYTIDVKKMKSRDLKFRNIKNTSLLQALQITLKYGINFFAPLSPFYENLSNRNPIDLVISLKPRLLNGIFEFAERFGIITHQQLLMEKTTK